MVTCSQQVNVNRREAGVFVSFFEPGGRGMTGRRVDNLALSRYGAEACFREHGRPASVAGLDRHWFAGYLEDMIQVDAVHWLDEVIVDPRTRLRSNSMTAQATAASVGMGRSRCRVSRSRTSRQQARSGPPAGFVRSGVQTCGICVSKPQ
ncbi:type 2 periplasmic-binding domain-containing protein [Zeimonas arvi]|uniref:Uncharacterized protein n=1 Tax=Zeimonas arvi TaxID=2498847 RepID=A0A5C8NVH1_9BURK|nr:hypothetical protein [Zeimonas arvi]TXL65217.1 hypothetical protein FHP08_10455 [Zeimonas arvi]